MKLGLYHGDCYVFPCLATKCNGGENKKESGIGRWLDRVDLYGVLVVSPCLHAGSGQVQSLLAAFTRGRVPKTWRARKAVLYLLSRGEIDSLRTPKERARECLQQDAAEQRRAEAVLTARVSLRSRQVRQPSETGITCVWSCTALSRRWITAACEERQCVVKS